MAVEEEQAHLLQALDAALRQGKAPAAGEIFREIAGLATEPVRAGEAVGKVLEELLDDFHVATVWAFAGWLSRNPAEDVAQAAIAPIKNQLDGIQQWRRVLREIQGERLARDLRAQIRSRDVVAATQNAVKILKGAASEPARVQLSKQVGAILGSLSNDRPRAEQVMAALERHLKPLGLDASHYQAMQESCRQIQANLSLSELASNEMQWNRMHTEAVVTLMRSLPGRGAVKNPGPEEEKRFYDALHAMVDAYFRDAAVLDFSDVARILQEFCPADERATGSVEGVEDAAFLRMGAPDRVTSVRALRRLGEKERLVDLALELVKQAGDEKTLQNLVRLMGGLSNPRFFPVLHHVVSKKSKSQRLLSAAIDALGRLGDDRSLQVLLGLLGEYGSAHVIDPPVQRKMELVIAALGRIARSPKTSPEKRNEIVLKTFQTLPKNRQMGRVALQRLCSYDPAGLSTESKRIAIGLIVDNLWSYDTRSKLAKGDPGQKTELGFREEMVGILVNLGSGCLPILLETAEKRILQYSGAYQAMAEALAKIGDERALPSIEKMVINALRTEESTIPEHLREFYYDAARNEFVPLSRDKIIYALLYAAKKTCGAPGAAYLRDLIQHIRSGEYQSPGPETSTFLGGLAVGESAAGVADAEDTARTAAPATHSKRAREEEPVKTLLKDILGKGLFTIKVPKRISAIHEAGARLEPEAISALCEVLDDEDRLVRAAAQTALQAIVSPRLTPEAFRRRVLTVLEGLRKAPRKRAKAIYEFLVRLHPDRDPLKSALLRLVESETDEFLRKEIAEVFRQAREEHPGASGPSAAPAMGNETPQEERKTLAAPLLPPGMQTLTQQDILALKREYFAARKAWVAGGKKGPEPKAPKGMQ